MIITRTPLRISFFGGGTDYPVWYRERGGSVLSTTIDKCCYITCRYLPPFFEYHSRISYSRVENVGRNSVIEHPSVRACLRYLGINEGIEIHHVADLPARTGLGTSSAFTVGLLLGLYALKNKMRDKDALTADAIHVEQELLREAVGSQDQTSAAHGGFNRINFNSDGSIEVKRMLTEKSRFVELQKNLVLFFTGFSRTASEVAQEQLRVTPQKQEELQMMLGLVDEAEAIVASPTRSLDAGSRSTPTTSADRSRPSGMPTSTAMTRPLPTPTGCLRSSRRAIPSTRRRTAAERRRTPTRSRISSGPSACRAGSP